MLSRPRRRWALALAASLGMGLGAPRDAVGGVAEGWTDTNLTPSCANALRQDVIQRLQSDAAAQRYSATKRISVELMAPGIHLERPVSYFYYAMPEYAVSASTAMAKAGPKAAVASAGARMASDFSLGMLRDLQAGPVVVARKTAGAAYEVGRWAYLRNHERYHRFKAAPTAIPVEEAIAYVWDEHYLQHMFVALELNAATNTSTHAPASVDEHHTRLVLASLEETDFASGVAGGLSKLAYVHSVASILAEAMEPVEAYPPLRRFRARRDHLQAAFQRDLTTACGSPPTPQVVLAPSRPSATPSRRVDAPRAVPTAASAPKRRAASAPSSTASRSRIWFSTSFSGRDHAWSTVNRDDRPAQVLRETGGDFHIRRTGAGGNGGTAYIATRVDIPVSARTTLAVDGAMVLQHDVRGGDGDSHGEQPLYVELVIERASGGSVRLRRAWNAKVANPLNRSDLIQRVSRVSRGQRTAGEWEIRRDVPDARRIVEVRVGGSGWNFESKLGGIRIADP